jgi:hypothetical protein
MSEAELVEYQQALDVATRTLVEQSGIPADVWERVTLAAQDWDRWLRRHEALRAARVLAAQAYGRPQ